MTNATMYDRFLAGDPAWNGRFFTGVVTTGIYCLPSCKARKPKPQHVRFFPTVEAARAAGFRPCRKCHPDDFARGADPVLETIETLISEVRANPAGFADVAAMVRRSGFGATRLFELIRQHYHATPADLLLRARLEFAKRQLRDDKAGLAEVSAAAGFASLSAFHEQFRRLNGLTPAAYRELRSARSFELALPAGYPLPYLRRFLGREPQSLTERLEGDVYTATVQLGDRPALLRLQLAADKVRAEISAGSAFAAHAVVVGRLGLDQDTAAFARLARRLGLARLVAGRPSLSVCQTPSVFDGLIWCIIGQQINFAFACVLKRRLIERACRPFAEGLYAPPTPEDIAGLEPADLQPLQFSRQKAAYVIGAARLVTAGKLDLEGLRAMSATRAERALLEVHGLGAWSANYLLMRSLGFADCLPLGDTGVTSGLQALFKLEQRPDADATRRLMAAFSPYRSLATIHLWQLNQPTPP
ncbi:MAG TPA: Ada metal-binding domain-containing protein [Opitutaceae bacterium]|nr:Ada metal-binding domain-containing protein [Opitutaceae bacterium]